MPGNRDLIITPTGCPMFFDDAYDKNNHWRMRGSNGVKRNYDICVVSFNEFVPEPDTYDMLIMHSGLKWRMLPEIADMIKWEDYEYIGYWDDDYCTDIQSVNGSLELARQVDMRLFQQAATSFNTFPCLRHNPEYMFTETNFIEFGVPFFRNDIFRKTLQFVRDYKYEKSEWGMDKVICYYLQATAHVIHKYHIKHCRPDVSSYDKADGFREMEYLMREFFPKYMKEKFNVDYEYTDAQVEYRIYRNLQTT